MKKTALTFLFLTSFYLSTSVPRDIFKFLSLIYLFTGVPVANGYMGDI